MRNERRKCGMNKKLYLDPELQILTFTQAEPISIVSGVDEGEEITPFG